MERLPLAMVQHMCLRKGMDASGSRQQLIDRLEQRELQERFEEMGHPRPVAPAQPPPAAATASCRIVLLREHGHIDLVLAEGVEERRIVGEGVKLEAIAVDVDNEHALAIGREGGDRKSVV